MNSKSENKRKGKMKYNNRNVLLFLKPFVDTEHERQWAVFCCKATEL